MSEGVKVKMSIPMFQEGELETFDNNIHSIIEKYTKMQLHEKDQILTQRIIIKQEEEIEELQNLLQQKENIIKEVREYIESYMPNYDFDKTNLIKLLEILDEVDKEK